MQSISASILDAGDDVGPAHLSPSDITIAPDGGVSVAMAGRRESAAAVRSVAEILHGILPDVVPAPLRLVASQAFFTPPAFATIREFSQALEFFERPNRMELVKEVYARYVSALAEAKRNPGSPESSQKPAVKPRRRPRISIPRLNQLYVRRAAIVVLGLGAGTLAAFGAFRVLSARAPNFELGTVTTDAAAAMNHAVDNVNTAVDNVVGRVLGVRAAQPDPLENPEPKPAVSTPKPSVGKPRDRSPRMMAPVAEPTASFGLGAPGPVEAPPTPVLPQAPVEQPIAEQVEQIVYSEGDVGVVPPTAIYPRLPTTLPVGVSPASVAVIDAVIDESGLVESVRVRRSPLTMSEAMVVTMTLSAAKTWRF